MITNIVQIENLHFSYPDGHPALKGVTFSINHGESVALVGENGAGKSTLLQHLNGFLLPEQGQIHINGIFLSKDNLRPIRKEVGMVFQNSDDQLFMPTVFDDVAFGPINLGIPTLEIPVLVENALDLVGVKHLIARAPHLLSQGEKKAIAIATVLAMSPKLIVMDEPSTSLDPKSRRRLINLLKTLPQTKIIATHDLDLALDLCDRTIVLHQGQITADGITTKIFKDDVILQRSNLEAPLSMQSQLPFK